MAGGRRRRFRPKTGAGLATLGEDARETPGLLLPLPDSSLLAFDFAGVHHGDMVTLLAEYGIALRGQHCAQPLLAELAYPEHYAPHLPSL